MSSLVVMLHAQLAKMEMNMALPGRPPIQRHVELSEPKEGWRAAYEQESLSIQTALSEFGRSRIEHIGSTAIPGIRAKPVIDIMVGVDSYDWLDASRLRLKPLGYEHDPDALHDEPARHVFRKGPSDGFRLRTHHLHYTRFGSLYWVRILAFRDYLRTHPQIALEYESLKVSLAEKYAGDGSAYTRAKGSFVRRVQTLAMGRP